MDAAKLSQAKHNPEPWRIDGVGLAAMVRAADATIVAVRHRTSGIINEANVRRIVACVNACEGYTTEELEVSRIAGIKAA